MATVPQRGLVRRLAQAFIAAAAGSFVGQQYAVATVPAEVLEGSHVVGMYATAGAIVGVLTMRMGAMLLVMGREFFGRER